MADWKQITARIRRARTSKDPVGQLSALYEKTHDAMVAFELAKYFETSANNADAAKWYSAAAERFRRADWKTKAQEAAVRLGAATSGNASASSTEEASSLILPVPIPEPGMPFEQNAAAFEAIVAESGASSNSSGKEVAMKNVVADAAGAEAATVEKLAPHPIRQERHVCLVRQMPGAAQHRHLQHRQPHHPQSRRRRRRRVAECPHCQ